MDTASEMRTRLNKSYKITNDEMRNNIKMSIHNLRLQRGADPEKHQEKFHGLVNKLRWTGAKLDDSEVCSLFLQSLDDYGRDLRLIWRSKPEEERTSLNLINEFLTYMESLNRWKTTGLDDEPLALTADARRLTKSPPPGRASLSSRMKPRPVKKPIPAPKKKSEEHVKCYRCNEYGHFAKNCNNPRNNDPALKSLPGRRDEHRSDDSRFDVVAMMLLATDLPDTQTGAHAVNKTRLQANLRVPA